MISQTEAAESLRDIARVSRRTGVASAYAHASPHLLLSGVVWTLGYIGSGLTRPEYWGYVWAPLALLATFGSFAIAYRARVPGPQDPGTRAGRAVKGLWLAAAFMVFTLATYLLFHPTSVLPYLVFPALLLGLAYSVIGAFGMPRFVWIGTGITAVTLAGLIVAPAAIAFWVAAAGGGGLLLGGLWLRKA